MSADPMDFDGVCDWIFDLDNTLYPRRCDLFSQVDRRMTQYMATFLDRPADEARRVQKDYYRRYGTTLRGLMSEHDADPHAFLRFVHDIDYTWLEPNAALGEAIAALPGRKFIFTNGDRPHAERAAGQIGIRDRFDDIFDLVAADFVPKPARETYETFLARHEVDARHAAMFEDLPRNLTVPKRLGMRTVLVVPENGETARDGVVEHEPGVDETIDHVTDDLAAFLGRVVDGLNAAKA